MAVEPSLISALKGHGFVHAATTPVGIGARVYRSTNQSIPTGTLTAITFDATRYDTDGLWAAGTPTRLTCTRPGIYLACGGVRFAANGTGGRAVQIGVNGTAYGSSFGPPIAGDATDVQATTVVQVAVGDYVEVFVYQTSGAALDVVRAGAWSPEFALHRLA